MSERDRLLVVDGDDSDRALTAFLLATRLPRLDVVEVADPMQLAEELEHSAVRCVVSEIALPWGSGLQVAEAVKRLRPDCAFVVFAHPGCEAQVAAGVDRGVDGFATKTSSGFLWLADTVQRAMARAAGQTDRRNRPTRLHRLVESLAAGTFTSAADGTVIEASATATRVLGAERESDLVGRSLPSLLVADVEADALRERLAEGRPFDRFEARVSGQDGNAAWVWISALPAGDLASAALHWDGIVQDITPFRRVEDDLDARARDLATSNAELSGLASAVSHDLQEPLHLIARYGEMLLERSGEALDEAARRHLGHLLDSAHRMQGMIDDVLELARVDTRGRSFAATGLGDAVAEALARLRAAIEETAAVVDVGPLPTVRADHAQMVQLFQNLVGNAIKFHGERPPHVRIRSARTARGWEISVADDGIGIPPEQHQRVFGLFQRLHTAEEYPGTGMGLAICKRIVERHGGSIRVDSAPGTGATFTFSLPVSPRVPAPGPPQGATHG